MASGYHLEESSYLSSKSKPLVRRAIEEPIPKPKIISDLHSPTTEFSSRYRRLQTPTYQKQRQDPEGSPSQRHKSYKSEEQSTLHWLGISFPSYCHTSRMRLQRSKLTWEQSTRSATSRIRYVQYWHIRRNAHSALHTISTRTRTRNPDNKAAERDRTHTVQQRLANRHHRRTKPHQGRHPSHSPRHDLRLSQPPDCTRARRTSSLRRRRPTVLIDDPEIISVEDGLDDIQRRLRGREAVMGVVSRPAVHVVDGAVEGVGRPDRTVQGAAGHAVRSEDDVARVPGHERQGDDEP